MPRPTRPSWSEEQVQVLLGNLLRAGVLLAAAVVAVGGILYLIRDGRAAVDLSVFRGERPDLRSLLGIVGDALGLRRRGIVQLGILLLIATPVMRVVLSSYVFWRQRDWTYVFVTLLVLAGLVWSLAGGIR